VHHDAAQHVAWAAFQRRGACMMVAAKPADWASSRWHWRRRCGLARRWAVGGGGRRAGGERSRYFP
jgi:hypothetical protein